MRKNFEWDAFFFLAALAASGLIFAAETQPVPHNLPDPQKCKLDDRFSDALTVNISIEDNLRIYRDSNTPYVRGRIPGTPKEWQDLESVIEALLPESCGYRDNGAGRIFFSSKGWAKTSATARKEKIYWLHDQYGELITFSDHGDVISFSQMPAFTIQETIDEVGRPRGLIQGPGGNIVYAGPVQHPKPITEPLGTLRPPANTEPPPPSDSQGSDRPQQCNIPIIGLISKLFDPRCR